MASQTWRIFIEDTLKYLPLAIEIIYTFQHQSNRAFLFFLHRFLGFNTTMRFKGTGRDKIA